MFWRELDKSFYEKNDIYGNKDLLSAAKSIDLAKRIQKELATLPPTYKEFYIRRIIQMLNENLENK